MHRNPEGGGAPSWEAGDKEAMSPIGRQELLKNLKYDQFEF